MHAKTKISASMLALAMLVSMSGCTVSDQTSSVSYKTETVELNDSRKVTCVFAMSDSKVSGMSCDWVHASGADLDPSKQ